MSFTTRIILLSAVTAARTGSTALAQEKQHRMAACKLGIEKFRAGIPRFRRMIILGVAAGFSAAIRLVPPKSEAHFM